MLSSHIHRTSFMTSRSTDINSQMHMQPSYHSEKRAVRMHYRRLGGPQQPLWSWQQWETPLIFPAITLWLFSLQSSHNTDSVNLVLQKTTKTGSIASVSHSFRFLPYDSTIHRNTSQLEGADKAHSDTISPPAIIKYQHYAENALTEVKMSVWICMSSTQHCCSQATSCDTKMLV
jgi:hypothetical protein